MEGAGSASDTAHDSTPPSSSRRVGVLRLEAGEEAGGALLGPAVYTRDVVQGALKLLGCRPRHAHKLALALFRALEQARHVAEGGGGGEDHAEAARELFGGAALRFEGERCDLSRRAFVCALQTLLAEYQYHIRSDGPGPGPLAIACAVSERRTSVCILVCGTSGTGKSTLASLLASRLSITTVVSTDSIRAVLQSFTDKEENPLLFASTYHAGEHLDTFDVPSSAVVDAATLQRQRVVRGYKAQSELVIAQVDRLIGQAEARNESLIIEGVHLSLNFVTRLMERHASVLPFVVHIANEAKHRERFAVRAKHMSLQPSQNRYIKYFRNIRLIQDYLCTRADKHLIPKINNTNVDRSVAAIHTTVVGVLGRRERGETLFDAKRRQAVVLHAEYTSQRASMAWSSKGALAVIRQKSRGRLRLDTPSTSSNTTPAVSDIEEDFDDAISFYGDGESDVEADGVPEAGSDIDDAVSGGDVGASSGDDDVDDDGDGHDDDDDDDDDDDAASHSSSRAARGGLSELGSVVDPSYYDDDSHGDELSHGDTTDDDGGRVHRHHGSVALEPLVEVPVAS